jgi:hypothetical protein
MRPYPPLTEALRNAVTRGVQVTAVIETLQGAGQRNHCGRDVIARAVDAEIWQPLNETATPAGIAPGQCTAGSDLVSCGHTRHRSPHRITRQLPLNQGTSQYVTETPDTVIGYSVDLGGSIASHRSASSARHPLTRQSTRITAQNGYVRGHGIFGSHSPLPRRPATSCTRWLLPGSFEGRREAR